MIVIAAYGRNGMFSLDQKYNYAFFFLSVECHELDLIG